MSDIKSMEIGKLNRISKLESTARHSLYAVSLTKTMHHRSSHIPYMVLIDGIVSM